ncbi:MAG: Fe(3+) dicitrate transport protein [Limisphaerales bacterium]|jgi:Fe(3+) dicitrate transport protein
MQFKSKYQLCLKAVFSILCLSITNLLLAQCSNTGTILDEKGIAIESVQVVIDLDNETQYSTITYPDGTFEFLLPQILDPEKTEGKLIIFSRGFETLEMPWKCNINYPTITLSSLSLELNTVKITVEDEVFGTRSMRAVEGMSIYAGKKSEVIQADKINGNKSGNNARQVFGKVAGLNIWESDGAGLQLGIGGRGLSPNRTANFNTRQDGYDISADALGYPESYYTPPVEALERIEVIRGAASLQYGTQFGGLLNFVLREAPKEKKFEVEARETVGAFGYLGTYASLGWQAGDWTAFGFGQFRHGQGWRENSGFDHVTGYGSVTWQPGMEIAGKGKHKLSLALTSMSYVAQQAGGLTDALFEIDPRQSIRERNWFKVEWNLINLSYDWKFSPRTKLNVRNFGLIASKDALGYLGQINRVDPEENRDLLSDRFKNFGNETRLLHQFQFGEDLQTFIIGARMYHGNTNRSQGDANDEAGPDFEYLNPENLERFSFVFPSLNFSLFAEQVFRFDHFFLTPGVRFESITTESDGYYREIAEDLAGNILLDTIFEESLYRSRKFVLAGLGAGYQWDSGIELYANFSQNYRGITFNDLRVINPSLVVDPDLRDEKGFSADLGFRGTINKWLRMDLSLFTLNYNDRIGQVLTVDPQTFRTYRFRTNVADSRTVGLEAVFEAELIDAFSSQKHKSSLTLWLNLSLVHARYINAEEPAVEGREVELVPPASVRSGLRFKKAGLELEYQTSWVGRHYTDATNAEFTPDATAGIIPSYYVMDFSGSWSWSTYKIETGITNLSGSKYFTRRATGYPGPGIIPSNGRGWYLTFAVKI